MIRFLAAVLLSAAIVAYLLWGDTKLADWSRRRREVRRARWQIRFLHSGHVDALPRTGGPKGGDRV